MSKITGAFEKYQFSVVRIFVSLYLAYFFIGMLEQRELIANLVGTSSGSLEALTLGVPALALILCILFLLGIFVSPVAVALFICYQTGFLFLPIPKEVQASYISLILLVFAFFGSALGKKGTTNSTWHSALFLAVYLGFSVSGLSKLFYEPWLNGEAIHYLFSTSQIGNMNGTLVGAFIPKTPMGYLVLFVEIMSLPLAIFKRTQPLAWVLNTALHLCIPIFLYVWPVSFGVLLMQMVLFDVRWFASFDIRFFLKQGRRSARRSRNY